MQLDSTGWTHVDSEADVFTGMLAARTGQFEWIRNLLIGALQIESGSQVIDVGCGIGDHARYLADRVGPDGRVVGLDSGVSMIEEATKRYAGEGLPLAFVVGDAADIDFPDGSFDRTRASLLLQHVEDPARVMSEMARVTRRGGLVLLAENDLGTMTFNATDRALTRRVIEFTCDSMNQGWIGRQLSGLFLDVGLQDIDVVPFTMVCRTLELWESINAPLQRILDRAIEAGALTAAEAAAWKADLVQLDAAGKFFNSITAFAVRGRKP